MNPFVPGMTGSTIDVLREFKIIFSLISEAVILSSLFLYFNLL